MFIQLHFINYKSTNMSELIINQTSYPLFSKKLQHLIL